MIVLWLIYHYKLQTYDSGVASIFHMPTKDVQEDNLLASATYKIRESDAMHICNAWIA
jgi:hypothetical protein